MEQHKGKIVEDAIRRSGFSFKKLAERLRVSRNTLYNRFKEPDLNYEFIMAVGNIIHYDFTHDFPDLQAEIDAMNESSVGYLDRGTVELLRLEKKYISLLERYNKLLGFLARLSNTNEVRTLKKEIHQFLEDNIV